jgi:hypothetical protein
MTPRASEGTGDGMVFRWLTVDPDVHEWLKAEAKAQGRSPAHLFRECLLAGVRAVRNGARLERPAPPENIRLAQVSLLVPEKLDGEIADRARSDSLDKRDLYRAYLNLGLRVRFLHQTVGSNRKR